MSRLVIGVLKETVPGEKRVALTPETARLFCARGAQVLVEAGAGLGSGASDDLYGQAGAVLSTREKILQEAQLFLCVRGTASWGEPRDLSVYPKGSTLVGLWEGLGEPAQKVAQERDLRLHALERLPRITRAQNMDVLSSQSNLAGYQAVLEGARLSGKILPLMMTAAGTLSPARILILGAGVAGLQAIATAKRLGAMVSAFDVRAAAREQVESLGATFIDVGLQDLATKEGYAREATQEEKEKQKAKLREVFSKMDIIITTAQIPGKRAPVLIEEADYALMKPGTAIVDLAAESGGNCEGVKLGKTVQKGGVCVWGAQNILGLVAKDASVLYAKNLFNFSQVLFDYEKGIFRERQADPLLEATRLA